MSGQTIETLFDKTYRRAFLRGHVVCLAASRIAQVMPETAGDGGLTAIRIGERLVDAAEEFFDGLQPSLGWRPGDEPIWIVPVTCQYCGAQLCPLYLRPDTMFVQAKIISIQPSF